jgi:M-phase inducer tyrosine phosphatase
MSTPPMDLEGTTPPVPSSPAGIDSMDISPLPHKLPYFVAQVTLPSPSPIEMETPDEQSDDHLSPPEDFPTPTSQPVQAPAFLQLPEYVISPSRQ